MMLVENFLLVLRSDVPYSEWYKVTAIAHTIVLGRSCSDSLCDFLNIHVPRAMAWSWRPQRSCWHDEHMNSYKRYGNASSRKFHVMLFSGTVQ